MDRWWTEEAPNKWDRGSDQQLSTLSWRPIWQGTLIFFNFFFTKAIKGLRQQTIPQNGCAAFASCYRRLSPVCQYGPLSCKFLGIKEPCLPLHAGRRTSVRIIHLVIQSARGIFSSFGATKTGETHKTSNSAATSEDPHTHTQRIPFSVKKRTKAAAELTFIVAFPPRLSWKLDRKWCSGCVYCLPVKSKCGLKWLRENRGGENIRFKSAFLGLWIAARFDLSRFWLLCVIVVDAWPVLVPCHENFLYSFLTGRLRLILLRTSWMTQ